MAPSEPWLFEGTQWAQTLLALLLSSMFVQLFRTFWRLRHVPGPFWARFTNIQRVLWVKTKRAHEIHHAVHERHGEVVRFGPNIISLANPDWIPIIYPIRPGFPKVCVKNNELASDAFGAD